MKATERRCTRRHAAGHNLALLEWAEGAELRQASVRLLDISQGGASFVAEMPPPSGLDVWLRLEVPRMTGWVSARVVRSDGLAEGGLSFSGYCPHDLIAGLV